MNATDQEYFDAILLTFNTVSKLHISDAATSINDKEKYVLIHQANSFKLSIQENELFAPGGSIELAMKTKKTQIVRYPKEAYGFPIVAYSVPIINEYTKNVLGAYTIAVSQEREQVILDMALDLQSVSESLASSSQQIAVSVEQSAVNIQNISTEIYAINDQFKELDNITNYVKSIADSTNLLGLNASIEAARAGSVGNGFSVVAQEIRKLAESSKTSSIQITKSLQEIKNQTNKVVEDVTDLSAISEEQASQIEEIASKYEYLNEMALKLKEMAKNSL